MLAFVITSLSLLGIVIQSMFPLTYPAFIVVLAPPVSEYRSVLSDFAADPRGEVSVCSLCDGDTLYVWPLFLSSIVDFTRCIPMYT